VRRCVCPSMFVFVCVYVCMCPVDFVLPLMWMGVCVQCSASERYRLPGSGTVLG
jgi:hypothetical protein